jgi:hypothetical protein
MRWATATLVVLLVYGIAPISVEIPTFLLVDLISGNRLPKNDVATAIWLGVMWLLILVVLSWLDAVRIGGFRQLKSLRQSIAIQFKGKRPAIFAFGISIAFVAFLAGHDFAYAMHPFAPNFLLALFFGGPFLLFRPAVAIFLGVSGPIGYQFSNVASSALFPLRGVTLLDVTTTKLPLHMFGEDNIRQIDSANWEDSVQELLDLVSLIVIDGRNPSPVVSKELQWILNSSQRAVKSVLVTNSDGGFGLSLGYKDAKNFSQITQCDLFRLPLGIWQVLDRNRRK